MWYSQEKILQCLYLNISNITNPIIELPEAQKTHQQVMLITILFEAMEIILNSDTDRRGLDIFTIFVDINFNSLNIY